jgi:hypothetical protein
MTITPTALLSLPLITTGTSSGTWGDEVDNGLTSYLDIAIAGALSVSFTANAITLANTAGTSASTGIVGTTAQYYILKCSSLAAASTITAPTLSKSYLVINSDATYAVTIKATGQSGVSIAAGEKALVVFNGTDYVKVSSSLGTGTVTSVAATVPTFLSVAGSPITTSGTLAVTLSGTALPNTSGGTGATAAFTQYGVPYASSTTVLATTANGTTGQAFVATTSAAPSWGVAGPAGGGTGVANNAAMTVTGSGNFAYTRTLTGTTNVTFPTTGTLATLAGTETFTNKTLTNPTVTNYVESVVAIGTVTSSNTLSLTSGTVQTVTLTASTACTFTMPTATAGKSFILIVTQASGGSGTAVFTSVKFPGGTAPTITAAAGAIDILTFVANGTSWFGTYAQAFA